MLAWIVNIATVLFNTGFAILAIVTLGGIVFITRPQQVMHDVPPWMWLPLLIVMAPAQTYSQFLAWATIFSGQLPTGPAIALRQPTVPSTFRLLVGVMWLLNFLIGAAIVGSLAKPVPGRGIVMAEIVLVGLLTFWLTFAANVYLLLAIRTARRDEALLDCIWRWRIAIDIVIAVGAIVYYRL